MHLKTSQRSTQNRPAEPTTQATSGSNQGQGLETGAKINAAEPPELLAIAVLGYN